jgi:hypothetical protein
LETSVAFASGERCAGATGSLWRVGKTVGGGGLCGPHWLLSVRGRVGEAGVPAVLS